MQVEISSKFVVSVSVCYKAMCIYFVSGSELMSQNIYSFSQLFKN